MYYFYKLFENYVKINYLLFYIEIQTKSYYVISKNKTPYLNYLELIRL